jgi:hypothetical protein
MRRAMIKMITTRASLLLTCSATSISSTPTAPVRLSDAKNHIRQRRPRPQSIAACRLVVVRWVDPSC